VQRLTGAARRGVAATATIGAIAVLLTACQGGPTDSRQTQTDQAAAPTISTLSNDAIFKAPDADAVPTDAEPVQAGDVGLAEKGDGGFTGTLPATSASCDQNGFMKIQTSDGDYLVGVVKAGDWDCKKALDQWNSVSKPGDSIGMRYTVSGDSEMLMLVNDAGGSLTMRVKGLYHIS
jgi:hypothetical protein